MCDLLMEKNTSVNVQIKGCFDLFLYAFPLLCPSLGGEPNVRVMTIL